MCESLPDVFHENVPHATFYILLLFQLNGMEGLPGNLGEPRV